MKDIWRRRTAILARDNAASTSVKHERKVSAAPRTYAAFMTRAARGAVKDAEQRR